MRKINIKFDVVIGPANLKNKTANAPSNEHHFFAADTMMKGLVRTIVLIQLSLIIYNQFISLGSLRGESDERGARRTQLVPDAKVGQAHQVNIKRDPLITREQCGNSWDSLNLSMIRPVDPFIWSISGGAEYRKHATDILKRWEPNDLVNVVVIAMDQETADHLCQSGYESVVFDRPLNSYSKVADAKFQVSRELSNASISFLFIELDIFCRASPLPDLMELKEPNNMHDIVVLGHNNNNDYTNIGMYYARASPRVTHFFERLVKILAPSKDSQTYVNEQGTEKEWFDQNIFNWCLKNRQFALVKLGHEVNACKSVNVTNRMVSSLIISSNEPPVVLDQTKCIHPLMGAPFSSFSNKLAIAKTLGFDLVDVEPTERFLKTSSSELTYFDHLSYGFASYHWSENKSTKHKLLYHFSALVALAKLSNRTLVLPHNLVLVDARTVPLYSLVNMRNVEEHISWRWEIPSHIQQQQDRDTVVIGTGDSFENITNQVTTSQARIVEVDSLLYLQLGRSNIVLDIMKNLTWCLDRFQNDQNFHYHGGRDWLCQDSYASPFVVDGDIMS